MKPFLKSLSLPFVAAACSLFFTSNSFADTYYYCLQSDGSGGTIKYYNPSDGVEWVPLGSFDNTTKGAIYCHSQSLPPHGLSVWNSQTKKYIKSAKSDYGYVGDNDAYLTVGNAGTTMTYAGRQPTYTFKANNKIDSKCVIAGFSISDWALAIPISGSTLSNNQVSFSYAGDDGHQSNVVLAVARTEDDGGQAYYTKKINVKILDKSGNTLATSWIPPGTYNISDIQDCDKSDSGDKDAPNTSLTLQQAD